MYYGLRTPLCRVRTIGFWEGWSFLILLGIAMPLKYAAGYPMAVTVVGGLHGILFLAYLSVILEAAITYGWSKSVAACLIISAVVPGGPFLAERWLLTDLVRLEKSSSSGKS